MVIESFLRLNTNIITYELMPKIHNYFLGENVLSVFLKMNCFDHCIILLYPSSSQTRTSIAKLPVGNSFFIKQWKSSLPIIQLTVSAEEMNLSTAIVHLLSIKSVAASKVAGQASAAKSELSTVIIAPCLINSIASPTSCSRNVNIIQEFIIILHTYLSSSHGMQIIYLK